MKWRDRESLPSASGQLMSATPQNAALRRPSARFLFPGQRLVGTEDETYL